MYLPEDIDDILQKKETEILEYKKAKSNFDSRERSDYCAAIANAGGGRLLLGVGDDGKIVGTSVYSGTLNKIPHDVYQAIGIWVTVEEVIHPNGRVIVFDIPPRPVGQRVRSIGHYKYPDRKGDSLVEMDDDRTREILNEIQPDFSSQIVKDFSLADIDDQAINNFKTLWAKKAQRDDYLSYSNEKTLRSIGLLSEKGLNYASLILFGKKKKIDELIPGSEIIFEWRQVSKKIPYDYRKNWREPFLKIYNEVWEIINARNIRFPFQEGLFQREVYAFSEKPIREAILNTVAHRDYSINNRSIFIKASPEEFLIESPGGFPYGITIENILRETHWRNRRIAETLEKAGLVERSGQGMDDIFESTIKEGKGLPDLSGSDDFCVSLKIPAQVKDKNFIMFIEKITREKQTSLSFDEIYELEKIREHQPVTDVGYKKNFLDIGIIEMVGKTSGAKYILSHKYYAHEGKIGEHTRLRGISREKCKTLILEHLKKNKGYLQDLSFTFQELKPMDISNLLQELKNDNKIEHIGSSRTGYWKLKN